MRIILAALTLLAFCPHGLLAWSGAGHDVIAAIAWRDLPPESRAKVGELLKAHPDYSKWAESFSNDAGGLDLPAYAFMKASRWPDEIRRRGNKYDHPHWHYVDWPLKPPAFPMQAEPSPDDDVLYGIAESEKALSNAGAPAEERAAHLSWLIHLIGDIHQPLHCASLFTDAYPAGDKGGNSFFVKPASRGINLHSLWDGLLGTSGKPQAHANEAVRLAAEHPRKSLPDLKHTTAKDWSLEGRSLAIDKAYLGGVLKGGASADAAAPLPDGYTKTAKAVAERQAALAGYRLADSIQSLAR